MNNPTVSLKIFNSPNVLPRFLETGNQAGNVHPSVHPHPAEYEIDIKAFSVCLQSPHWL